MGVPIGIEAPAVTLEIIYKLDKTWIETLSKYIIEKKIEFIGSGYSQLIGPLVPGKVNKWNQQLGLEYYRNFLNVKPQIALVNEMAYSGGIVEHYIDANYSGIIMEWNNPRASNPQWQSDWRYYPQKVVSSDGRTIPLIWADSIAFQKFQRYAHGEIELDEYLVFIKKHCGETDRYFPLYSNDVEVFDNRPGRYQTEAHSNEMSEWIRISALYQELIQQDWCEFVSPSQVKDGLKSEDGGHELKLQSAAHPIPVKKQGKYNIIRWALSGRDDVGINSKCYKLFELFGEAENSNSDIWKSLCYLWSSDFRTHITEQRWEKYLFSLNTMLSENKAIEKHQNVKPLKITGILTTDKYVRLENENVKILLNKNKGLSIKELIFKGLSAHSLLGTIDHGYYEDISLGADYYSGHLVVERYGEHKITDLLSVNPIIYETNDCINITSEQDYGKYTFSYSIKLKSNELILEKLIKMDISEKSIIRPFNFTFNPESWERKSLYVATHSGGSMIEKYYLHGQNISHGDIYSSLISSCHGFGNTEGIFIVGDRHKSITFFTDMSVSAVIPSLIYKEFKDTYFFRMQYSCREMDETRKINSLNDVNTHIKLIISVGKSIT
jgi:hypothetical protein